MNTIGNNIKITFFGESHGPYLGVVIDNLPPGLDIDEDLIKFNLSKRRPAKNIGTARVELDKYQIISGYLNGKTTGSALTFLIENNNTISKDYEDLNELPRPSHADYPAGVKYKGFNDYRGGGFFSGRLTALWMIVGSIAEQILKKHNIIAGSHVYSLHNLQDHGFDLNENNLEQLIELNKSEFPLIDLSIKEKMIELITKTKENSDSVGGVVESKVINLPVGLGEPYFLSVESYVSSLLFSVPAVKAVAFGLGCGITKMFGSEANDEFIIKNGNISTLSNNNGGVLGGLTTGSPLIVKVGIKPTPSISKVQNSVNTKTLENVSISTKGRHDPQIVTRAVHVINSVICFACLDLLAFQIKKDDLI